MKTLKNPFAALMLMALIACQTVFAAGNSPDNPVQGQVTATESFAYSLFPLASSKKMYFTYINSNQQKVTLRFFDQKGNLITTDALKNAEGFHKYYNFEQLGNGSYTVEITCGNHTEQRTITIGSQPENQEFLAYISPNLKDNKVKVAFQHANSPVIVAVRDIKGQILYSKEVSSSQNFASVLDLQKLQKGTYVVSVSGGNKSIEKTYYRD
jgi:hypothetical protein